jgi:hypothetical protein
MGEQHCIARTDKDGVCEASGSVQTFETCDPNDSAEDESCEAGHACLPSRNGGYRCQLICDPWADSSCAADAGTCVPTPGVLGTCQRNTNLNAVDCSSASILTPCATNGTPERAVCLPDGQTKRCKEVCRLDQPSDCFSGVCNPTLVPGDIGWGQCTSSCTSDSDCDAGLTCRVSRYTNSRYCAQRCGSDADCTGRGMICKDGFCD